MKHLNFDKIREENDLKQYIESKGISVQNDNKFLCPFHEDTNPSANIYEKDGTQYWKCFVCDIGGDVIEFVSKIQNCSKSDAIQQFNIIKSILEKTSYPNSNTLRDSVTFKSNLKTKIKNEGIGFLKETFPKIEIENEAILEYLGWDTYNDSLTIIVNNKTIKTHHKKNMTGKWITSKGSSSINLFPESLFKNSNKEKVVICEGEKDALNLYVNGITAITLGSAIGDWSKHKNILKDCDEIVLAFDFDQAGDKGKTKTIKALASLDKPLYEIAFSKINGDLKKGYDVSDFLKEHKASELFSHLLQIQIKNQNNLNSDFEKELATLNICAYFDENKKHYLILDAENSKIIHNGNKQQIQQILSSILKRTIKPEEYSEFPLCYTFYDPANKPPIVKNGVKPINVFQKPNFRFKEYQILEIPATIKLVLGNSFQEKPQLDYFINWLACFLQTGEKSQISFVLISGQGVGKGILTRIIEEIFCAENCIQVTNTMIESDFNDYMYPKQMLILNEINTVNDVSSRKHMKNKLKSLITDPTVMINTKNLPAFSVKNVFNILMTTNESHPLDVEVDDRRFTIIKSNGLPLNVTIGADFSIYNPLIISEIPDFYQYLMSYKCDFMKYNTPLETEYKAKLKGMSQTFDDRFALAIAKNNIGYFEENLQDTIFISKAIFDKETVIQEYKTCIEKEFIPNEFLCSLYRNIKGVEFNNQHIKGRLISTGIFETYRLEDSQINMHGKTTRGIRIQKDNVN